MNLGKLTIFPIFSIFTKPKSVPYVCSTTISPRFLNSTPLKSMWCIFQVERRKLKNKSLNLLKKTDAHLTDRETGRVILNISMTLFLKKVSPVIFTRMWNIPGPLILLGLRYEEFRGHYPYIGHIWDRHFWPYRRNFCDGRNFWPPYLLKKNF